LHRESGEICSVGSLDVRNEIRIYIFQDLNSADANTIGSIAGFASIDWGAAIQVMTAITSVPIVIIGTDNALKAGYCAKYFDCLFAVVYMWPSSSLTSLYVVLEHDFLRDCKIFTYHVCYIASFL